MGFQTMGVSLPFAIGVALSMQKGKGRVYSISGDGSFLMRAMALATAVESQLPIIHFIWKDNGYNLVAIQETHKYQQTNAIAFTQPIDFAKMAESFGAKGIKVSQSDELPAAIKLAQNTKGPVVIEIDIDYSDNLKKLVE
jgi:acetolactate synthase-1/2/3 large subunit